MRQYDLISADSHLEASPDRWRPYVDAGFREWVPKVVELDTGGDAWLMPGSNQLVPLGLNLAAGRGWENVKQRGLSYADNPPGSGDADQRLEELDADGVDAEILFPAISGARSASGPVPSEAVVAIARGYNDWLSTEFCAADYDRLLGAAVVPATNAEDAAAELRRVSTMPGIRTVVVQQWPNGSGRPSPDDDVFWAVAAETGVPLSVHISISIDRGPVKRASSSGAVQSGPVNGLLTRTGHDTAYCMTQLIKNGVFDRWPGLRINMAESGAGWVPYYAEQADTNYLRHRHWAHIDLAYPPSHYVFRHFLFGIQDDFFAIRVRDSIGVRNIMWATDFPHAASDWPASLALVERLMADVGGADRRAMVAGNAVEFFKLQ